MWIAKIDGKLVGRFFQTLEEALQVWPRDVLVRIKPYEF